MNNKNIAKELIKLAKSIKSSQVDTYIYVDYGKKYFILKVELECKTMSVPVDLYQVYSDNKTYSRGVFETNGEKAEDIIYEEINKLKESNMFSLVKTKPGIIVDIGGGDLQAVATAKFNILEKIRDDEFENKVEELGFNGSVEEI